ncbi:MAG TPA: NADPH-dependent FMN reductase [Ktedonobacteraceae bacterium]|nr:NADPH-dependent FMN reductase [Ktedonobacteraceae bacterium]
MENPLIRVLLLSGSLRYPSHTHANLEHVEGLLRRYGVVTNLWDLFTEPLPILNPKYHRSPHLHELEVVRRLVRLSQLADAFVWGTPVYHNSFSGILKNALDHLNTQQFRNKPIALISNGGMHCTAAPCDQLRIIAHGLLAVAIPTQVVTADSDFDFFQGRFVIVNTLIKESLARLAEELLIYSLLLRQLHKEKP